MKNKKTTSYLLGIYVISYFTWKWASFLPIFSIAIASVAVLLLFFNRPRVTKEFLILVAYTILVGVIYKFFVNDNRYYFVIDNCIKILIILLYGLYFERLEKNEKAKHLKIAMFGYVITDISTLISSIIDPEIVRRTAYKSVRSPILLGIGGYDYIYGLIILNITIFAYLQRGMIAERKKWVWFVVLNTATIVMSGFTTATVFVLLFFALAFVYEGKIKAFIITILSAVAYSQIVPILLFLSKLSFLPSLLTSRLLQFAYYLNGTGTQLYFISTEGSRGQRMLRSWEAFKQHPLFGSFIANDYSNLGEHTEWVDRLAQFGIIVFLLIAVFWLFQYKQTIKQNRTCKSYHQAVTLSYLYFLVLGFFNPNSYPSIVFPLLIVMPNLWCLFGGKEDESTYS